jgi:hypothetical protein
MSTSPATLAAEERADARFYEQIATQYRDYLAYLEAQLTLLDIQQTRTDVAFERAETRDDEERAAHATLAALPPPSRALFDAVLEHERLEVQQQLESQAQTAGERARRADPDEAAMIALRLLRDEANGIGTEGSKGLLPRGAPDAIKWYAVDVAALRAAPSAAAYAVGATDAHTRKRMLWQASAAGAVILLALIWLFLPRGNARPTATSLHVASANDTPLTAWPVQTIVLTATHGDSVTVPISPTAALEWPRDAPAARAYWRTSSVWPIRLCVPAARMANLDEVRLIGGGASPDRSYTIPAVSPTRPDLVLEACERGNAPSAARLGVFTATTALPLHAIGQAVTLPQSKITVTAISITGPGEDPSLPADQARISVRVQTTRPLYWPLLAPTLLLASGAASLPSDASALTGGTELRYLVALPSAPLDIAWSITPHADVPVVRWRTTLEPPPSRASVLRDALAVQQLHAAPGDVPGTIAATLIIANRGKTPLQLSSADISLMANNQPLATPDLAALRQPLAPGEQRTLVIPAPLDDHETLVLTVGVARFALERAEGR